VAHIVITQGALKCDNSSMHSPLAPMFALLVVGIAAPGLHASTVYFQYTGTDVSTTAVSGTGFFTYNGALASIGLGNVTSFAFELDLSTPGAHPDPATFDFDLGDLQTFSASISGGVVTALSLTTDYQAASNTSNYDENQKSLVVTTLATASINSQDEVLNQVTQYDTGTITILPEPSTGLLVGGAALLAAFWRRTLRAQQG